MISERILLDDLRHGEEAGLAPDHQSTKEITDQGVDQEADEEVGRQEMQLEVLMKKFVKKLVKNVIIAFNDRLHPYGHKEAMLKDRKDFCFMLKDRKDFCLMLHVDKLAFSMFRLFLKLFYSCWVLSDKYWST